VTTNGPSPEGLGWKDVTVSKKPYPKEFRDDVVRVARNREPGVGLDQIASDFGVHYTTLYAWLKQADVEDGNLVGATTVESAELREARRRIRTLEHEVEVLRRATAYFSQSHLPGK
jgi:transposase